jgi:integrase
MNDRKAKLEKAVVSVSEMAAALDLSRARFYQLLDAQILPQPVYDLRTRRPVYPKDLQEKCLAVRQTGIGSNGRYILFYSPRKNLGSAPKKSVQKKVSKYQDIREALTTMGLDVSDEQVSKAVERILSENDIHKMISCENHPRNKLILRVLYASGIRVSELCRLCWKDCQPREKGGQISIYGKGGKTNTILIPENLWNDLVVFRANTLDESPLFTSRKGRHFNPSQVWRIVRKAARKAGIEKDVSPHWYRHAHASHALQRGASIALVQRTLAHSSVNTTGRYLHVRPEESSSQYLDV